VIAVPTELKGRRFTRVSDWSRVSFEVGNLDGPQSPVWDEAENRLHAQKALALIVP
jgi:hypothetical protein